MALVQVKLTPEQWVNRYNAEKTKKQAMVSKRVYDNFLEVSYPSINESDILDDLKNDPQKPYMFLDQMVQYWYGTGKSPKTVKSYFGFIRDWLKVNGIRTNNEDVKEYVKFRKPLKERKVAITYDEIREILKHSNPFYQSLWLFLTSSGARIDCEVFHLKRKHLKKINGMWMLTIPADIAKSGEERITFISSECYKALEIFIKTKSDKDEIFDIDYVAAANYLRAMREKTGLNGKYSTGFHYITLHVFRSFFISKGNKIEDGLGHALAGHGKYMKSYERYSDEELSDLYRQLEPYLTIHNDEKLKSKVKSLEIDNSRIAELERQVLRLRELNGTKS